MVLTRESEIDDEGFRKLKVTGESLETIFKMRHMQLVWEKKGPQAKKIFVSGSYNGIAQWAIRDQMIENTSGNRIRNLKVQVPEGFPSYSSVPFPPPVPVEQGYIHDLLRNVCHQGDIGYRLLPVRPITRLTPIVFDAYTPRDRTKPDDYVIFGELFENVSNVRTFSSLEGYFNRIWINSWPEATTTYWHEDGALEKDDFARRLGYHGMDVKSELESEENTLTAKQIVRAQAEEFLAKAPPTFLVDGEMDHLTSTYEYEKHYHLGDLVHYVDVCSSRYKLRVEAQTFVSDDEGFRTYPTLAQYSKYNMNIS